MPGGIGLPEIMIVLVIALLVLGPKRLPETGRSLGRGLREFKDSIAGNKDDDDDRDEIAGLGSTSSYDAETTKPKDTTTTSSSSSS